jgi:hypothetical protein
MLFRVSRRAIAAAGVAVITSLLSAAGAGAVLAKRSSNGGFPRYDHIFLLVDENHNFAQIIGNPNAPVINALAGDYGLARNYHGVADPSEPNYVAMLGGSSFGIVDDEPYFWPGHTAAEPNLMSQLEGAHLSWKGYFQGMPYPGYRGYCFPAKCNGIPDSDTQYVAKHNGIPSFADMQTPANYAKQTPYQQLESDLASGHAPNFSYIVPDECDDMHGAPPWCLDSNEPGTNEDDYLVSRGDAFVRQTVEAITSSSVWSHGTNAIVVTFDEGEEATEQIPAIVITSHGPRGFQDPTLYNHYSLLRSFEEAFGLGCLRESCAATPMTPLFQPAGGSSSMPSLPAPHVVPPDGENTVSPTGAPVKGKSVSLTSGNEWQVVPTPDLSSFDNDLSSVSAASPTDAWAVGAYYPPSNPEVLSTLGMHWEGKRWTAYPMPNVGPNENSLLGVSELGNGEAWAAGYFASANYEQRTLIEHFNGSAWEVLPSPNPGAQGNIFYGVSALDGSDVWAVGGQRDSSGIWHPLVEHYDGSKWSVVSVPDPGNDVLLYAISASSANDIYAVGQEGSSFPSQALLEHYNGKEWSVTKTEEDPTETLDPFGLDATASGVTVVGARESDETPFTTLAASGTESGVTLQSSPSTGTGENDLFGATTAADGSRWAAGWYVVEGPEDVHRTLLEHEVNGQWSPVASPNPSEEENGFSSITAIPGGGLWAAGITTNSEGNPATLIAFHR